MGEYTMPLARRSTRWVGVTTVAVLWAAAGPAEAQCAMCRTALASPEGQHMIAALRNGILVLLATPFALFSVIAVAAVRMQRARQRAESDRTSTT